MSNRPIKGYKVTNIDRSRTCGLACKTLSELLTKSCSKFQFNAENCTLYLQDGTIVDDDDYFSTLPSQTCFILSKKGQTLLTGADIIYNALKAVNINTLKTGLAAQQFIKENLQDKLLALVDLIKDDSKPEPVDRTGLSSRLDDPAWFQGLDTGAKTKEEFMRRRCGDRMRGYLYKAEKDIKQHQLYSDIRLCADNTISALKKRLSNNMYMGYYFDRSKDESLCNLRGQFNCHGLWNRNKCSSSEHSINPYSSREQRIIFSTWNLDHRIEKSREVIPTLVKACLKKTENPEKLDININYFFSLLFTTDNLRLVHIVCHDKTPHLKAKCDSDLILIDRIQQGVKRKQTVFDDELIPSTKISA